MTITTYPLASGRIVRRLDDDFAALFPEPRPRQEGAAPSTSETLWVVDSRGCVEKVAAAGASPTSDRS